jgi:glutaredoxin 2
MSAPATSQPQLYIYDHCPFCCRARVALGLKKVKYDVLFLANHDEATPIALVGSKQAPIFVPVGEKPFPESWDIVKYVDSHYGDGAILKPSSGREDLAKWIDTAMPLLVQLYLPRFHAAPLPEFTLRESRDYFKNKKEKSFGSFSDNIAKSPELVAQVNKLLLELEPMLHSGKAVNESGQSLDDLDLFGRLRGLTLVKGVEWPTKVRAHLEYFSEQGDVPLYDNVVKI